ncbi:hypothetical protein PFISCL1PPCAC_16383 [Pristionchus fissidentatus]|uniref:Uncharacterized protein n=1 Tax=Pristionchus fissidentatus TaxID=1538716 RepID=A0AAV5W2X1_9BILA|nr:hypothetical protein PFISCL1PPCAC_16383 [Pristionchus fissidentatus]
MVDFDWSSVIPKMFERKLTSLSICNYDCPSYLPKSSRTALVKSLTSIRNKEISFASSMERISSGEVRRQTVNDYRIEETNSIPSCSMSALFITHKNREPSKLVLI